MGEEVGFLEVHCRIVRKMVWKMEDDLKRWMREGQCGLLMGRGEDLIAVVGLDGC